MAIILGKILDMKQFLNDHSSNKQYLGTGTETFVYYWLQY